MPERIRGRDKSSNICTHTRLLIIKKSEWSHNNRILSVSSQRWKYKLSLPNFCPCFHLRKLLRSQNPNPTPPFIRSNEFERSQRAAISSQQDSLEASNGAGSHRFGGGRRVVPARGPRRREGKFRQRNPLQREDRIAQVRGPEPRQTTPSRLRPPRRGAPERPPRPLYRRQNAPRNKP